MADIKFNRDLSEFDSLKEAVVAFDRARLKVDNGRHYEREVILEALSDALGGAEEEAGTSGPSEDDDAQGSSESQQGYSDMKNEELRDLLAERDLATSGNKDELVARLEADDAGETEDDGEFDDEFGDE